MYNVWFNTYTLHAFQIWLLYVPEYVPQPLFSLGRIIRLHNTRSWLHPAAIAIQLFSIWTDNELEMTDHSRSSEIVQLSFSLSCTVYTTWCVQMPLFHASAGGPAKGIADCYNVCQTDNVRELCKSGWTDRDAVWKRTLVGQRNHVLDVGEDSTNPFAAGRGDKSAMRPFVKILWPFVVII